MCAQSNNVWWVRNITSEWITNGKVCCRKDGLNCRWTCNLCCRGGSWNSWRSKKPGCCFPSQTWYFSSYTQQLLLAFFTACFWGLGIWVRICTGIGKEAKGYDNNGHNHMKIPGREFHYNIRSCLMLFQNVFISVIPALFHPKAKESMGFCLLFIYLFICLICRKCS